MGTTYNISYILPLLRGYMTTTTAALIWITTILQQANIPFQITGGLAARAYGATRELADIDIEIPEDRFIDLQDKVSDFVVREPYRDQEEPWDLLLMTLRYKNQDIDISGAYTTKILDKTTHQWVNCVADFSKSVTVNILGIDLPVIPLEDLLAYKKILSRDVDIIDINQIKSLSIN